MAIDSAALKTECQQDPTGLGLALPFQNAADAVVADMLNLRRGTIKIARSDVTPQEVIEAILQSDILTTVTVGQGSWFESCMQLPALKLVNVSTDGLNTVTARRVMTNIKALLSNGSGSETRLTALASRSGSRAEQVFGEGVIVTANDVAAARNA